MLLTAPQLASVVTVAKRAELTTPKRILYLPCFRPDCSALACWSVPVRSGLPFASPSTSQSQPR